MTSRCTNCNKMRGFRNQRGNKLSNYTCECGGKFEILGGSYPISGKHPFDEQLTYTHATMEGEYWYAYGNRKKEYFVLHEGYFHKVENPVIAKYIGNTQTIL